MNDSNGAPPYTNIQILKTSLEKIDRIQRILSDEIKKNTGHRLNVTRSIAVEEAIKFYLKENSK